MRTCSYCGEEIEGERIFCKYCGRYLPAPKAQKPQEKPKKPTTPAINDSIAVFVLFVVGLIIMMAAFVIALVYPPL